MDPIQLTRDVLGLILDVKNMADQAKRNRYNCKKLAELLQRLKPLVDALDAPGARLVPEVSEMLVGLKSALKDARELIERAGKMSKLMALLTSGDLKHEFSSVLWPLSTALHGQ